MPEVLYKIGDSAEYRDGDVLAVKPDGYVISWTDIQTWMKTGNATKAISIVWPDYLLRGFNRRFRRLQYIVTHTPTEASRSLGIKIDKAIEENRIGQIELAKMEKYGIDTSWGWEDLKTHGVIKVDMIDEHDKNAMLSADRDDDAKAGYNKKRCHGIDYKTILSSKKKIDLEDKLKYIPVDRASAYKLKDIIKSKYGKLKDA